MSSKDKQTIDAMRRQIMKYSALTLGGVALSGMLGSLPAMAADEEILIGYWPIVGGLPLYVGIEKGFFKRQA